MPDRGDKQRFDEIRRISGELKTRGADPRSHIGNAMSPRDFGEPTDRSGIPWQLIAVLAVVFVALIAETYK